jgi:hypothetical protein
MSSFPDDTVAICGGWIDTAKNDPTTEIRGLDGQWRVIDDICLKVPTYAAASATINNSMFVLGGCCVADKHTDRIECWDPRDAAGWHIISYHHVDSVCVIDDIIYASRTEYDQLSFHPISTSLDAMDTRMNKWTAVCKMPLIYCNRSMIHIGCDNIAISTYGRSRDSGIYNIQSNILQTKFPDDICGNVFGL